MKGEYFHFGETSNPKALLGKWDFKTNGTVTITCKCGKTIYFDVKANRNYKR